MKMPWFIASVFFLTFSVTSYGDPPGGGFRRSSFHGGFVAHSAGEASRMGPGIRDNFSLRPGFASNQNRRFFHRDRRVFLQGFVWPVYWHPYDYSYLDYRPDDYQYWDNSAGPTQPESSGTAVNHGPIVVVINKGNSGPADSSPDTANVNSGYSSTAATWQQRTAVQAPNESAEARTDPSTFVSPAAPQPTQAVAKSPQITSQAQTRPFGNLVLVSWLEDAGKDVIYVQNTETNDVQKITSDPNLDNFRIVELHPNPDPKLFEAIISNGNQQGPVRFHF